MFIESEHRQAYGKIPLLLDLEPLVRCILWINKGRDSAHLLNSTQWCGIKILTNQLTGEKPRDAHAQECLNNISRNWVRCFPVDRGFTKLHLAMLCSGAWIPRNSLEFKFTFSKIKTSMR